MTEGQSNSNDYILRHDLPSFSLEVSEVHTSNSSSRDDGDLINTPSPIRTKAALKNTLRRGKTKSLNNVANSTNNNKVVTKAEWDTTPPRPPNAWILYRSIKLKEMKSKPDFPPKIPSMVSVDNGNDFSEIPSASVIATSQPSKGKSACLQAEVSRIISTMWKNEDPQIKANYVKMAEDRKKLHTDMFPDYKYKPKRQKSTSSILSRSQAMNRSFTSDAVSAGKGKKGVKKPIKSKSWLNVDAEKAEYIARLHPRQYHPHGHHQDHYHRQQVGSDCDLSNSDYSPYSNASVSLPSYYHHGGDSTTNRKSTDWDQSDTISETNSNQQQGLDDWSVALAATMSKSDYEQHIKKERLEEMEMHFSDLDGSTPSTADSAKLDQSFNNSLGSSSFPIDLHHHHHQQQQQQSHHHHSSHPPNYFGSSNGLEHIHHTSPVDIKFTSQIPRYPNDYTPTMPSSNQHSPRQHYDHKLSNQAEQSDISNHSFPNGAWHSVTNSEFLPYLAPASISPNPSCAFGTQNTIPYSPSYSNNDLISPIASAFQQQSTIGDATIFLSQLNVGPQYSNRNGTNRLSVDDLVIINHTTPHLSSSSHFSNQVLPNGMPSQQSPSHLNNDQFHHHHQQQQQFSSLNEQNHLSPFPEGQQIDSSTSSASHQLLRPGLFRNAHSECGHDRSPGEAGSALSSPAIPSSGFYRNEITGRASNENVLPPNSFISYINTSNELHGKQFSIHSQW